MVTRRREIRLGGRVLHVKFSDKSRFADEANRAGRMQ